MSNTDRPNTEGENNGIERVDRPETNFECKKTVLRAEQGDTVEIGSYGRFEVKRRTDPYFGPKLILHADEIDKPFSVMLTAPGPKQDLQLWWPERSEPGLRSGWIKGPEVYAELVDTKQYDICSTCGEPIKNTEHRRLALIGACEP